MRRHLAAWCTVALGLFALGACAQPAGSVAAGGASPTASAPAPASPSPTVTPAPSPSPTSVPPVPVSPVPIRSSGGQMYITGVIYTGAEPSCLLMKQGQGQYLLMAPASMKLRAGERAVVTGHLVHGIMTHCMQGQPFEVTNVDQLTPGG